MVHAARLQQQGQRALAAGEWSTAREAFESAGDSADSLDGLGRALWWLKDVGGAIQARSHAFREYRHEGRDDTAATVAVWISRELRTLFGNDAAADGWLARAATVADSEGRADGWISLARGEAADEPGVAVSHYLEALERARQLSDANLEIISLARLGLHQVASGEVAAGTSHIDEAMVAASSGEADDPQSVCEVYCILLETAEVLADEVRFAQWSSAITGFREGTGLGPLDGFSPTTGTLSVFCGACCGGMYLATGRVDEAEDELKSAIVDLEATGMRSRCVHPATRLAEIRILQGRLEEARLQLEPYEDLPESVRPLALLDIALGTPRSAVARLRTHLEHHHQSDLSVAAIPLLSLLADAELAAGDQASAGRTADRLTASASSTGSKRHVGEALLAQGKVAAAAGDRAASTLLRDAARLLAESGAAVPACRARLELGRALADDDRPVAITEARAALAAFDRLGATTDADAAAAFLRDLGVKGRTGPKTLELLSKRELEVLRLVAQGFSNPEIGARLFISTKTAEHHVSNILTKVGLRSRTEAAAFAATHLGAASGGK